MKSTVTTVTRSPLGFLAALILVAAFLLAIGISFASDGGLLARSTTPQVRLVPARTALDGFSDSFRKFSRPELIAAYGVLILLCGALVAAFGSFIRSYRFRFLPRRRVLERQALWLYLPAWALVSAPAFFLILALDLALSEALLNRIFTAPVLANLGSFLTFPAWIALTGGFLAVLLAILWFFLRAGMRWSLFIPGGRMPVPFASVKSMEIRTAGEGGTILVLTLTGVAGPRFWVVARGSPRRLQRLGRTLARSIGLERRDLVTWSGRVQPTRRTSPG